MSAPPAATGCQLCGGALPEPPPAPGFCCEGCVRVAEILDASGFKGDRRQSAAYLQAARAGLVPADRPATPAPARQAASGDSRELCLGIDGLWCPSCGWLVEEVLGHTPGVQTARVAFFADLAEIRFDPAQVGEKELEKKVEELGYKVRHEGDAVDRGPLMRFGFAAFLQMNIMWMTLALYTFHDGQALEGVARALPWLLAILAVPVIFVAGWPTLQRAWLALRKGALVMDSLIAFGSIAAFSYSVVMAYRGSTSLYFDGACGLITFRLLGRLLEQAAFRSATKAGEVVRRLLPRKARKLSGAGASWVPADALVPGDRIRVAPGERVPLDGRVVAGAGRVSTAVVDGEPRPRQVQAGDEIPGGSVCGEAALDLEVTAPAGRSLLARVAEHVARASGRRGALPDVADTLARLFIPGVLVLSFVVFAAWIAAGLPFGEAFERGLAVLVVSCPCALGLAAPLARVVAAGSLARRGIVARGEGALDLVASAELVAFDKTGTLTAGRPVLSELQAWGSSPGEALAALAGLEERAGHPIAAAVREALPSGSAPLPAVDPRVVPGCGVTGTLQGRPAFAGRPDWVEAQIGGACPAQLRALAANEEGKGRTAILLAWGEGSWAAFSFGDTLRSDAPATMAELQGLGLSTVVLSGDAPQAAAAVARQAGAGSAVGSCLPEGKAAWLEKAQAESGKRPLFVGDGINDAPGLASSVGVAVASGTDFARETADVLLLDPGLRAVPELVRTARRMRRTIRQNLAWAAVYNALLIPLAATGHLSPVWAAAAMVASGLLVVGNALRLQEKRAPTAAELTEPATGAVPA